MDGSAFRGMWEAVLTLFIIGALLVGACTAYTGYRVGQKNAAPAAAKECPTCGVCTCP